MLPCLILDIFLEGGLDGFEVKTFIAPELVVLGDHDGLNEVRGNLVQRHPGVGDSQILSRLSGHLLAVFHEGGRLRRFFFEPGNVGKNQAMAYSKYENRQDDKRRPYENPSPAHFGHAAGL